MNTLHIAARLLLNAKDEPVQRAIELAIGLERHAQISEFYRPLVSLLPIEGVNQLVVSSANTPADFRIAVINQLGRLATPKMNLPTDVEVALRRAAETDTHNYVIQAAGRALKAWGEDPPLRVALKNRDNQSGALFVLFLGLLPLNLIAAFVGLIACSAMPLKSQSAVDRGFTRGGLIFGWIVLSFAMVVMLLIAFLGFLGHNSAPSPQHSLKFNVPAYVATILYVYLATVAWRKLMKTRSLAAARE